VIIACRDAADTLGKQLEALTHQQDVTVDWDVVLSDNGSTDDSRELAASFADRLQIRVVNSGDRPGAAHARNAGVAATTAPWLAFVDADDVVPVDWVRRMAEALTRDAFVAGRLDGKQLNSPRIASTRPLPQQDRLQSSRQGLAHAASSNMGIHRDVFLSVGGFDETLPALEDTDFCWRVQLTGTALKWHPELIVHIRLRASTRTIWRQGLSYGAAAAELDRRYPVPDATAPTSDRMTGQPRQRPGWVRLLLHLHRPLAAAWILSWHVGYGVMDRVPMPRRGWSR
jgi:glycosyltransferase involved in cell wall biosynthesis